MLERFHVATGLARRTAVAAFAALAVTMSADSADAGGQRHKRGYVAAPAYVVAESRFGHGSITGPVRPGPRRSFEVRMPGGTWIDCGRDCADTLRRQTVDIWENIDREGIDQGRGYLSWSWSR